MEETPYLLGREDLVPKFLRIPFLNPLGKESLTRILKLSKLRKYDSDEEIITEGATDRWVYVLISGKVKVVKQTMELSEFHRTGDIFGELALVDESPRSASVVALEPTVCLAIDASALNEFESEGTSAFYVILYRSLSEILANRLRITSEELIRAQEGRDLMEMYMKNEWYQGTKYPE